MIQLIESKRKKQPEFDLQVQVCSYLKLQYPDVFFLSDTVASLKLTVNQQARNKKIQCSKFKCPDMFIVTPNKEFHGLFIELKKETPFNKYGSLKLRKVTKKGNPNDFYYHYHEQQKSIDELIRLGYYACFSWTFEMTKNIIDNYLKNR